MGERGVEVGHLERRMDSILRLVFGYYAQDRGPSSSKIILTIAVTVQTSRHIYLCLVLNLKKKNYSSSLEEKIKLTSRNGIISIELWCTGSVPSGDRQVPEPDRYVDPPNVEICGNAVGVVANVISASISLFSSPNSEKFIQQTQRHFKLQERFLELV